MTKVLLIGAGGFIGALARYFVATWVQKFASAGTFPYGTLLVNLSGCLVVGILSYLVTVRGMFDDDTRAFLFVGIMGAYTTFSTFGNETLALFRDGKNLEAFANVGLHMILGLGAVALGRTMAGWVWK